MIAAGLDPAAIAALGLDLVDLDGMALDAAQALPIPVHGLLGEPHLCNDDGNGLPVYAAPGSAIKVVGADHCDFEWPTGPLCTTFCSDPPGAREAQIHETIVTLATAFALWQSGQDPAAESWWREGGAGYELLLESGAIVVR